MKRICHVQVLPILSGVQRSMLEMFEQLDSRQYEIHVACQSSGPLTLELERRGISVHRIPTLGRSLNPWKDARAYWQLRTLFRQQRFDLVHTHSSKPGMVGRLAARAAGVPVVVHHVHAFAFHEFSPRSKRLVYSQLERWASRFCDQLLFVNREERNWVVQAGWLAADRCHTIYNGVDLRAFNSQRAQAERHDARRHWGLGPDDLAIVFVGRLDYPKQPELIPEIARALESLRPAANWRILVAGDGPAESAVAARIADWKLTHRVQLLGWQDRPARVVHGSDVVLLTSLAEGLPLALIEAQAAGKPVVAGNAKGVREVVTAGTGFLCPPKDPRAYAERLADLVDDPALVRQLGERARRHAMAEFDAVVNNRRIAALYDRLLGAAGRPAAARLDAARLAA